MASTPASPEDAWAASRPLPRRPGREEAPHGGVRPAGRRGRCRGAVALGPPARPALPVRRPRRPPRRRLWRRRTRGLLSAPADCSGRLGRRPRRLAPVRHLDGGRPLHHQQDRRESEHLLLADGSGTLRRWQVSPPVAPLPRCRHGHTISRRIESSGDRGGSLLLPAQGLRRVAPQRWHPPGVTERRRRAVRELRGMRCSRG
mmetsp:Transcript_27137/g.68629  ORF Transcript_27137/g.68629 Transcript_27137/m.68629 type:complete len:202 (+) Transcript_27137:52-657(+)